MSEYAIEFNNVWKKFRRGERFDSLRDLIPAMAKRIFSPNGSRPELEKNEFWALKDVSFKVKKGEVLGIIGPNGAGKSTILKAISRIIKPDKGEIITRGRVSALIEVGAGFHLDLTGRENIYLNGAILGMTRKEIDEKFDQIVDFAGLREFIDTPIKRYSSGMQARLGFAVAAHMDPDILLVDEVLSVGDANFRKKCLDHMQRLIQVDNVTVVFVSHNMELVRQLCSSCLVLNKGELCYYGDTESCINVYLDVLERDGNVYARMAEESVLEVGSISKFQILDKDYRPTKFVKSRAPLYFLVEYQLDSDLDIVVIEIASTTSGGLWLWSCSTFKDGVSLPNTKGKHAVYLYIDHFNLTPGDYDISVSLKAFNNDVLMTIDDHYLKYKIFVVDDHPEDLFFNFDRKWIVFN